MSIINEALKKVQTNLENNENKTTKKTEEFSRADIQKQSPINDSRVTEEVLTSITEPITPADLTKIEKKVLASFHPEAKTKRKQKLLIGLASVTIAAGLLSWNQIKSSRTTIMQNQAEYPQNTNKTIQVSSSPTTTKPQVRRSFPPEIIVQGTMSTDQGHVALINDNIYEIGDKIIGMVITDISINDITVQTKDGLKTFKTGATKF